MEKLKEYGEKAVAKGARTVVLVGSLARGDYTAFSDADILIIADNIPKRPIDRLKEFIDPTLPIDLDVRVYTSEEFLKMAEKGMRIVKEVVRYGIVIAGDPTIIGRAKDTIKH
ncbi:MAG: nucleotidyltransferase domain-containing protein [Thermoprotei archaeon]|nr:MAG: nucleotidyltransferase domain-containing protein [Thermoprotei archaeon]